MQKYNFTVPYQFIGSVLINLSTLCTLLILNYSSYYISAQLIIMIRAISVIIALLYTVSLLEFKIDHLRFTGFRELLFDGSGYFSASVMHTILLTLDIFLIQKFSGNEWLASYKIALEYSHLIFMPYLIVTYVYVPKLSTSLTTSKDIKGIQLILNEVSRVLFVSSVIIAVILFFCSSKALVLLFGTEYANSVSIVKLLLPVLVLITIFGDPLNTLYLLNDKKSVYGAQITALLFMIILAIIITGFFDNFYLIYVGALGILIQRFIMFRKLKKNHDLCSLISF